MNRKPLFAIAAFAVLGLVAVFALRQPEKGESVGDRERPLAKLDAASFDTIEVTRQGVKTTIKKEGDQYKVTAPVAYPADSTNAKAAFEALTNLSLGDLVTENKAKQAEFEVGDTGVRVVAKSSKGGDKAVADIIVGKVVGSGTMVRVSGKDAVWLAGGAVRNTLDKLPADWRDKTITTIPAADVETVTVKGQDGTIATAKRTAQPGQKAPAGGDDQWELVTSTPKIDKLDNAVPAGIVSALSAFKANDFADGAKPAETGLDAPALFVTVGLKGGKNETVWIGKKKGEDEYYVKTANAPQVYLVKKFNVERINKRPVDWKDKLLCDVAEADLAEVAVTNGANSFTLSHASGAWKATKPAKLEIDPTKTPSLGGGFKDLKATGFAEDPAPAATGLSKPRATILAKAKKGDACSFKVGDETKDKQGVYLTSAKSPDVYVAPKWAVDRILVKVDDLKKK